MSANSVLQRLAVRRRLNVISRRHADSEMREAAMNALLDFEAFYKLSVTAYIAETGASSAANDAAGAPILDSLIEFIKWAFESGFLEFLVRLFAGLEVVAGVESQTRKDNFGAALTQLCGEVRCG